MNNVYVCKFGGSSLSDANQFKKVKDIIKRDERRRFIVPSAPGKRFDKDRKVTDLLYLVSGLAHEDENFDSQLDRVENRFKEIAENLNLVIDLEAEFKKIKEDILNGASEAYIVSRGEYLSGRLLSEYLGFEFIDPTELIMISRSTGLTRWDETRDMINNRLKNVNNAVIPGFYGINIKGDLITYTRGGSDVSAAVIARGLNADLYENWTDVNGVRMVDPRISPDSKKIEIITYHELRELAYMGASVIHQEAMIPCMNAGIPIAIKNTNDPMDPGTKIVDKGRIEAEDIVLAGISGKEGFLAINIEKMLLNQERGILSNLLAIFNRYEVAIEHIPTGIDSITVVVSHSQIETKLERIIRDIQVQLNPDSISIFNNLAIIAVVGRNMFNSSSISSKIFTALGKKNINVKLISQGISQISILVGVDNSDLNESIRSIYDAFK